MQSLVLLPITFVSSVPAVPIAQVTLDIVSREEIVFVQKFNTGTQFFDFNKNEEVDTEVIILASKAEAIDSYFAFHGLPLEGYGMKMVLEAEKNNLDWRLIPAIAMRESTGGKFACKKADFNPFGWGSCKIHFDSYDHAIEIIAKNLGGNNPRTANYYADKDIKGILQAYNPPSIVRLYAEQVMDIMKDIASEEIIFPDSITSSPV